VYCSIEGVRRMVKTIKAMDRRRHSVNSTLKLLERS